MLAVVENGMTIVRTVLPFLGNGFTRNLGYLALRKITTKMAARHDDFRFVSRQ